MTLTKREREVAKHLADSNAEIARRLGLSLGTVKVHVYKAMCRTGARNRTELALMCASDSIGPHGTP